MRCPLFLFGLLLTVLPALGWGQDTLDYSMLLASDGNIYGIYYVESVDGPAPYFFSYSPETSLTTTLNAHMPGGVLCLETPSGTFLAVVPLASNPSSQILEITTAGTVSVFATFPGASNSSCPTMANDGNYYGSSTEGGAYSHGYLYQLTPSGKINDFYDFTGTIDGNGPAGQPLQASNGTLYFFNYSSIVTYNATDGLSVISPQQLVGYGPPVEANDGNFYLIYASGVTQVQPSGKMTTIYPGPPAVGGAQNTSLANGVLAQGDGKLTVVEQVEVPNGSDCGTFNYLIGYPIDLSGNSYAPLFQVGSSSLADNLTTTHSYTISPFLLDGNGTYYGWLQDEEETETYPNTCSTAGSSAGVFYQVPSPQPTPPIQVTFNPSHILPGGTSTVSWKVENAFSDTMQQCYGYAGLAGSMAPEGKVALTGSEAVTMSAAGTYHASIMCGGTEAGFAVLTAGDAVLTESVSASTVPVGSSATLTGTVTNAGSPGPTGSVKFYSGSIYIGAGTLNSSGVATFTASTNGLAPGIYPVTASYAGDANYGPDATGATYVTVVAKSPSALALTPAAQSVVLGGSSPSFTVTASGNTIGHQPSGTVTFLSGPTVVGSAQLTAMASESIATFSVSAAGVRPGTYSVTASYAGDIWNNPSTSAPVTVTVQADSVAVTAAPNPVPAKTAVTLTATATGSVTPTGTVVFYAGSTGLGSNTLSNGVASITIPAGMLATGSYQVTAYYAGDKNNPAVTSPAVTLTVQ